MTCAVCDVCNRTIPVTQSRVIVVLLPGVSGAWSEGLSNHIQVDYCSDGEEPKAIALATQRVHRTLELALLESTPKGHA